MVNKIFLDDFKNLNIIRKELEEGIGKAHLKNEKIVDAEICWLPHSEGWRSTGIPINTKYGPIIVFEGQEANETAWSAEVYVIRDIGNGSSTVRLTYLSPEAPFQNLTSGRSFELFEGARLVARGRIL